MNESLVVVIVPRQIHQFPTDLFQEFLGCEIVWKISSLPPASWGLKKLLFNNDHQVKRVELNSSSK